MSKNDDGIVIRRGIRFGGLLRTRRAMISTVARVYSSLERGAGLRFFSFEVVIEKEPEDPGYMAYSPTLPGCFGNGPTIEDAKRSIRQAVERHLATLLAHGEPIPQNEHLVHVEELTVGIPG